jgi:hypothetical protein
MLKVLSPFDQSLIKEIPFVGKEEVEKALATAYALFQNQSSWIPAHERIAILERTVEIMKTRMEELTKIAAQEGGKPYQDSKVEVLRAINGVKLAAEHIAHLKGEQIPMGLTKASENRCCVLYQCFQSPFKPNYSSVSNRYCSRLSCNHQTSVDYTFVLSGICGDLGRGGLARRLVSSHYL